MGALDTLAEGLTKGILFSDMSALAGMRETVPRLSRLQRKELAIQPTQTASERIFSRLRMVAAAYGCDSLVNDKTSSSRFRPRTSAC